MTWAEPESFTVLPISEMFRLKFRQSTIICRSLMIKRFKVTPKNIQKAAATPQADEICLKGAKGLAMTALDILESSEFRSEINALPRCSGSEGISLNLYSLKPHPYLTDRAKKNFRPFGPEVFTIIFIHNYSVHLHRYEQKSFYTKQISVYSVSSSSVYGVT